MSAAGRDPRRRSAERFAERHARTVLARTDVRLTRGDVPGVDLVGPDLVARIDHEHRPVERATVERLHDAAGSRVAVFYSRAGYEKTTVLWADEHHVALFGYSDDGFAAAFNQTARDLVQRGQADSEQRVRSAAEHVARHATAARQAAERVEREAHAAVLRAEQEDREAEQRKRRDRERDETVLGRTVVLLLQMRLDPTALTSTVERLTSSSVAESVADRALDLSAAERPHAVALVRSMFEDAAAVLDVLTPTAGRDSPGYRATRGTIRRGLDALDLATGRHGSGHVSPDDVAEHLRAALRRWRMVVAELARVEPWAQRLTTVPEPRRGRHLVVP